MSDSKFLRHEACDACGSRDGNAVFDDGHTHCFVCGKTVQGDGAVTAQGGTKTEGLIPFSDLTIQEISARKLWNETCRLFMYGTNKRGEQVATYYDKDGKPVGQKLRTPDKKFSVLGDITNAAMPFGAQLWAKGGKKIIVTEGEIDAMSVSQAQGNRWPVVSIPTGAGGQVKKWFAKQRDYFMNFEEIILMFDMDEVGQHAAREASAVLALPHGRVKIASLPLKDANEMLKAGKVEELVNAIWRAVEYRPGGSLTIAEITPQILTGPLVGEPWYWNTLTTATYGRRRGEIYTLGAGTGIGKTSAWIQQGASIIKQGGRAGFCMLETPPAEVGLRVASAYAGIPFFIPKEQAGWTQEQLTQTLKELEGKAFIFDSRTSVDWESVERVVRYWANAEDVVDVVIDHLSAFSANEEDDRKVLDGVMMDMSRLTQELQLRIYLISHLRRPNSNGRPHEEGGRVELAQLRGSNAIGMWSNFVFGMERNQQAQDKSEQKDVIWRVLKDRNTGRATGDTIQMRYDEDTARLEERSKLMFQAITAPQEEPFHAVTY